jgi:dTDP-4-amino-4,6-dideoxygalactose transaminase
MLKHISFSPIDHYNSGNDKITKQSFELATKNLEDRLIKFYNKSFAYLTFNGREAIRLVANEFSLKPQDEVFITTTFNYPNVSSCVTSTIFNYCKPSRVFSKNTKAIFIIHEFGVPHPEIISLKKLAVKKGIPLIEDCAHTMDSCYNNNQQVGFIGDYVILSFPKIFPVTNGGALVSNIKLSKDPTQSFITSIKNDLQITNALIKHLNTFSVKRRELFAFYFEALKSTSLQSLISPNINQTPWFFPVISKNPIKLISIAHKNQIDAGLWHGSNVVVLPLHQYLEKYDIQFIVDVLRMNKVK